MSILKTISGFSQLVQTLEGGKLHADLSDEIQSVITTMSDYASGAGSGRAKGEITLTLSFDQELEQVKIRAKVKTKTQEVLRRMSALFVTPNNKLSLEHPMQNSLPLGTVVRSGKVEQPSAMVVNGDTN